MDNPGRFISILHRKAQIHWTQILKDVGISAAEYPILICLNYQDGITQEEITERLGIDKSAVTRVIQSLYEKGMVERKKDKIDRRCNRIYLTEEGKKTKEPNEQTKKEWSDTLMKGMTEEEKILFLRLLIQAVNNIKDIS